MVKQALSGKTVLDAIAKFKRLSRDLSPGHLQADASPVFMLNNRFPRLNTLNNHLNEFVGNRLQPTKSQVLAKEFFGWKPEHYEMRARELRNAIPDSVVPIKEKDIISRVRKMNSPSADNALQAVKDKSFGEWPFDWR